MIRTSSVMRERCQVTIEALDVPVSRRDRDLIDATQLFMGKPVTVLHIPDFPSLPAGFVIDHPNVSYMFIKHELAPEHRRRMIAHEVGHLVLGHTKPADATEGSARLALRHGRCRAPGSSARHLFELTDDDMLNEVEAELFAHMLLDDSSNTRSISAEQSQVPPTNVDGVPKPREATVSWPRAPRGLSAAARQRLVTAFPRALAPAQP